LDSYEHYKRALEPRISHSYLGGQRNDRVGRIRRKLSEYRRKVLRTSTAHAHAHCYTDTNSNTYTQDDPDAEGSADTEVSPYPAAAPISFADENKYALL
jgi:hypothetical protein